MALRVFVLLWLFLHSCLGFRSGEDAPPGKKGKEGKKGKKGEDDDVAVKDFEPAGKKKTSKVLILSANTEYAALRGPTLARLFEEGLQRLLMTTDPDAKRSLELEVEKPGDEDKPINWLKIRTILYSESIDLIVIGCQECTKSSQTAARLLACKDRLGTLECGPEDTANKASKQPSALDVPDMDMSKMTMASTFIPKDDFFAKTRTKAFGPISGNMMYQGVLANVDGPFAKASVNHFETLSMPAIMPEYDEEGDEEAAPSKGYFGGAKAAAKTVMNNKGAIISELTMKSGFKISFASTHLDAFKPAVRLSNIKNILKVFKESKHDTSFVYGDLNYRLYAHKADGSLIKEKEKKPKKADLPDPKYYLDKIQDKGSHGPEAEKLFKKFEKDDSFTVSWPSSPFHDDGFKYIKFTENTPPTYKIQGIQAKSGYFGTSANEKGQEACNKMKFAMESPDTEDAPEVHVAKCYKLKDGVKTKACEDAQGKETVCVDFGWLDRVIVKTPGNLKVDVILHTSLGWWLTQTEGGLGDHSPIITVAAVELPEDKAPPGPPSNGGIPFSGDGQSAWYGMPSSGEPLPRLPAQPDGDLMGDWPADGLGLD